MTATPSLVARWAMAAVRWYQRNLSPRKPPTCRFSPTCSEYMVQALQRHGLLKGLWLGTWRILRCNPWTPGGYDPVSGAQPNSSAAAEETMNGCSCEDT